MERSELLNAAEPTIVTFGDKYHPSFPYVIDFDPAAMGDAMRACGMPDGVIRNLVMRIYYLGAGEEGRDDRDDRREINYNFDIHQEQFLNWKKEMETNLAAEDPALEEADRRILREPYGTTSEQIDAAINQDCLGILRQSFVLDFVAHFEALVRVNTARMEEPVIKDEKEERSLVGNIPVYPGFPILQIGSLRVLFAHIPVIRGNKDGKTAHVSEEIEQNEVKKRFEAAVAIFRVTPNPNYTLGSAVGKSV